LEDLVTGGLKFSMVGDFLTELKKNLVVETMKQ